MKRLDRTKILTSVMGAVLLTGCPGEVGELYPDPLVLIDVPHVAPPEPAPQRMLRRLSPSEYDRTITALLGVPSTWGTTFAADPVLHGFPYAPAAQVSPLLAEQLRTAAEALATQVVTERPDAVFGCPTSEGQPCAERFIDRFGRRVFRRPLTPGERQRYVELYRAIAEADGNSVGFELLLTTFLQSPHFLYRSEVGQSTGQGRFQLTAYEIATQLSYTLTGGPPDDALLDAAQRGDLNTEAGLQAEISRLTPQTLGTWHRFIETWLGLDRLAAVPKDPTTYPELTPELRQEMTDETRRFITHVLTEGSGNLQELLTAPYTFASPELARFYGLPAPDADGRVSSSTVALRGLLTQGSVLTTHAKSNESSPIHRGLLIRERFFCQTLPPPPPGVNAEPPPFDPTLTVRERFSAHSSVNPCLGCHRLMDPLGFTFEFFDGVGRHRTDDHGHPIDASGEVVDTPVSDGPLEGLEDLADRLAWSRDVQDCFVRQWLRFTFAAKDRSLAPLITDVQASFRDADFRLTDLMAATVTHPWFKERVDDSDSLATTFGPAPVFLAPESGVEVQIFTDSDWGTGYCKQILVRNPMEAPVRWVVTLPVEGNLGNAWNAETQDRDRGRITFSGVTWNAMLNPADELTFGFCAHR